MRRATPLALTTLLALFTAVLATGCARIQPAWTDIPDSDLAERRSFRIDTASPPAGFDAEKRQVWEDRRSLVRGLVREALVAKGYHEMINEPDFVVRFWGKEGGDYAQEHHDGETKGTLDIRAMDPKSGKWLWHGWASETLTRRLDVEAEIREAVASILAKFPRSAAAIQ